ncbi:MAG: DUF370 domain-containing protein [Ruminiclostridium sp.]|nr:DUF370 domain-containing protein [Ruminiclostridium sp.]
MYLHLGSDISVHIDDIIGIFDIEKVTVQKYMNDYLSYCQKNGKIYYVSLDMPKSIIVCSDIVYISNVSCLTLRKRADEISSLFSVYQTCEQKQQP